MQKSGDVCESCRERWEKRQKEPKVLQRVGAGENGTPILACEYCDGPVVERFRKRTA